MDLNNLVDNEGLLTYINSKEKRNINIITGDIDARTLSEFLKSKNHSVYTGFDVPPSVFGGYVITGQVFMITWNMEFIDYLLEKYTSEAQVFTLRVDGNNEIEYWYFTGEQALESRQHYSLELR